MNRRDFLLFRTEGRTKTVELSCERLYMRYLDARTLAERHEVTDHGGEPPARFDAQSARALFEGIAEELRDADVLRITQAEWLAADDFKREVIALVDAVRARGGRVDWS